MTTAIYIHDGTVQLVLTPQTEFEKKALLMLGEKDATARLMIGSFYETSGDWIRNGLSTFDATPYGIRDSSLIIRVNTETAK